MADQKSKVPRPTKAQLEAVKKTAEAAGEELDREQEDSVLSLAEALGEIAEGEALAHIDARLGFVERAVERLTARREEADRGFQSELNVMRVRIEDALEAMSKTVAEQRNAIAGMEISIAEGTVHTEGQATEVLGTVRGELAGLVQDAVSKLEKFEARLTGELKAMQEGLDERQRAASTSVGGLSEEIGIHSRAMEKGLADLEAKLHEITDDQRRELEARVGESQADLRLELHTLRKDLESIDNGMLEAFDAMRSDINETVRSSEEKAANAAIHLDSMIVQLRKQLASTEQEFSGGLSHASGELSSLKVRIEELAKRVDATDARGTKERGAVEGTISALSSKVAAIESRVAEVVEEVVAKNATRMEVLASQVANIHQADVAAEETSGAVEYLSRRLAETSERLDALMAKVNTFARGTGQTSKVEPLIPEEIDERLSVLESRMAAFANKPRQDAFLQSIAARLDSIERKVAEVGKTGSDENASDNERVDRLEQMLNSIPETLSARQAELFTRLNEIEKKLSMAPTILPERRKKGLWN